ncbi:MAG: PAS domain-containing sensor histidine kinase [Acidimicrobiia bacterium]|nr:PAS domain-containing sensor histidine kinase [Acidimicrobiia bacterium]
MAALGDLLRHHTFTSDAAQQHLKRLVAGWGPISDLSFGDLLLFVPAKDQRLLVVGQVRPTTTQTLYRTDQIGLFSRDRPLVAEALSSGQAVSDTVSRDDAENPVTVHAVPIRHNGLVIAVLVSERVRVVGREPGELERSYLRVVDRLFTMVAAGSFPYPFDDPTSEASPRVGDGVIVLDTEGTVEYTSPNAVSALHRTGFHANAVGRDVTDIGLPRDVVRTAYGLRAPLIHDLERGENVAIQLRLLPLLEQGRAAGALVLLRDISDIRRQERLLVSMDATIREIHHRVKNNLQTVSSLLRLQGRRVSEPAAKTALDEASRRIRSIALVHEVLSRDGGDDVGLGDVVHPVVQMVQRALMDPDRPITISVEGDGPVVPAETASSLAVVLTELIQNAVEHGFPRGADGTPEAERRVKVEMTNKGSDLTVRVIDNGVGIPGEFSIDADPGLGLTIIRTLATADLGGVFSLENNPDGPGAVASLSVVV